MLYRNIILASVLLVFCNLVLLNGYVVFILPKLIQQQTTLVSPSTIPRASVTPTPRSVCDETCIQTFQDRITKLEQAVPQVTPKVSVTQAIKTSLTQEIFIPLGSGQTTQDQWEDIPGTDVYIDTAKYPRIQTVYFETSLRIPTKNGEVFARLYNVTDKHPVWFSDTSTTADTSVYQGKKIQLDSGNKQYRVQMKTTLRYDSILDSSKIKILTY